MKRPLFLFCLLICVILTTFTDFSSDYNDKYSQYDGVTKSIQGTVNSIEFKNKNGTLSILIYLDEGVLVNLKANEELPKIGSRITLRGKLKTFDTATNQGEFDARKYYEILGIHLRLNDAIIFSESEDYSHIGNALFTFRRFLSNILDKTLPEETAGVMKTMLLGEKGELDNELKSLYQRNGISHILSISGLHISVIGIGLFKFLRKTGIPVKPCAIISSVFLLLYAMMTGLSVSSIRATIMFFLSMCSLLIGRTYDLTTSAGIAGLLILLQQPLYIHHTGFAFSFGCVISIGLFGELLTIPKAPLPVKAFISSLTILVTTLPIYYIYCYQIPVYSVLLNVLVIPVMTVLMPLGIILLIIGSISLSLGQKFGLIITGIINFFTYASTMAESLPFHYYTPGRCSNFQAVMFYLGLTIVRLLKNKLTSLKKYSVILLLIIVLTIRVRSEFVIHTLDVGQGDCTLVQTTSMISFPGLTSETNIMIDCGSTSEREIATYKLLPFLKYQGISTLDWIFVTHPDADHINGVIELIENMAESDIKICNIGINSAPNSVNTDYYQQLLDLSRLKNVNVIKFGTGDSLKLRDLKISCIWPVPVFNYSDTNEESLTLLIDYKDITAVFPGDIENNAEITMTEYLKQYLSDNSGTIISSGSDNPLSDDNRIRILKCAHHGSSTSTSLPFLKVFNPDIALISCGLNNRYGHPHKETLDKLTDMAVNVMRTDKGGQLTITVSGKTTELSHFINSS